MGKCDRSSSDDLASSKEERPQNEESSLDKEEDDQEELKDVTWLTTDDDEDDEDSQPKNASSVDNDQDASACDDQDASVEINDEYYTKTGICKFGSKCKFHHPKYRLATLKSKENVEGSEIMQMMYQTIFKVLEEAGLEKTYHSQDYLNFFCLRNRKVRDDNEAPSASAVLENKPHARALKNHHFMIHVNSKGMIVDDEYIILGSSNGWFKRY